MLYLSVCNFVGWEDESSDETGACGRICNKRQKEMKKDITLGSGSRHVVTGCPGTRLDQRVVRSIR